MSVAVITGLGWGHGTLGAGQRAAAWRRPPWRCTASAASNRPPWPRSPARAGLTERTFFRYFADKREVLFGGAGALQELLVNGGRQRAGIGAADRRGGRRSRGRRRRLRGAPAPTLGGDSAIIAASAELRERELIKLASLAAALAEALRRRGVDEPAASLTAEAGIAVFRIAFERWVEEGNQRSLTQLMRESLDQLKTVTAGR